MIILADEEHGDKSLVDPEEPLQLKKARLEHFVGQVPALLRKAEAQAAAAKASTDEALRAQVYASLYHIHL